MVLVHKQVGHNSKPQLYQKVKQWCLVEGNLEMVLVDHLIVGDLYHFRYQYSQFYVGVHVFAILHDDSIWNIKKNWLKTKHFQDKKTNIYHTWNHTCTRDSLKFNFNASSSRANTSGYGARSKARSNSSNWYAVNVVL